MFYSRPQVHKIKSTFVDGILSCMMSKVSPLLQTHSHYIHSSKWYLTNSICHGCVFSSRKMWGFLDFCPCVWNNRNQRVKPNVEECLQAGITPIDLTAYVFLYSRLTLALVYQNSVCVLLAIFFLLTFKGAAAVNVAIIVMLCATTENFRVMLRSSHISVWGLLQWHKS